MKRQLSLVLALVMILGSFSAVFAAEMPVTQVEKANFLKEVKVLEGNAEGDLNLAQDLKRRDALVVLSRLFGKEEAAKAYSTEDLTFTDLTDPFYNGFVAWAVAEGYAKGKVEGVTFDPNGPLTTQAFATMTLRALGYEEDGKDVFAEAYKVAKDLGILEGVEVEEKDTVTRGDMAAMTYNALGVVVNGKDVTLAEKLGIEMPVVEAKELKVEKVYTENLAEIVVELSNAKLATKEKLEDANNYKLTGFSIVKAEVQEDNVVLSLKKDTSLVKGRKYDLLVRGLGKDLNKKYNFTAEDNTIPAVESVEILGEYGIRVTTTEPVKTPLERNFLIDGKNVAMEVEQYGREIILTPYHKASFDLKAEKLTVKELVDYEGYKSVEKDFEIEVKKDEEAPKVIDVIANNKEVKVIFDKDIYNDSVGAYYSRVSVGNISYEAGRHPVYAEKAEKVDTNEVVYTFKDELPRRTIVTIVDVSNHSKVEMETTTEEARIVLDNIEPEIIDHKVRKQSDSSVKIELYFDKDVKGNFVTGSDTEFVAKDHFALYQAEVLKRNILEDKITKVEYAEDREDVVIVTIVDLQLNNKDKDYNYILEIVDFKDMSSNKMYRDYVDFDIKAATSAFKVVDVVVKENKADTEITIFFNKAVDRTIAEDLTNYIFRYDNAAQTRYDVKDLDGKIITERNGKEVTIVLPDFNKNKFKSLEILETIKDKDGNRVAPSSRYIFGTNFDVLVKRAEDAVDDANALLPGTGTANELALETAKNELVGLSHSTTGYTEVNHDILVKAIEKVEKAIAKVEEDNKAADKDALLLARVNLRNAIRDAEALIKDAPTSTEKTAVVNAIANSKLVVGSDLATTVQLVDSKDELEIAVNAYNAAVALPGEKTDAKNELDAYVDAADYTKNAAGLASAIATGKTNIDTATDAAGVTTALANAKLAIDGIKTDAQLVEADKGLIEAGTYKIPAGADQTDQTTKTAWVQGAVNALIVDGTTAVVTHDGTDYVVTLTLGSVTDTATIIVTEEI